MKGLSDLVHSRFARPATALRQDPGRLVDELLDEPALTLRARDQRVGVSARDEGRLSLSELPSEREELLDRLALTLHELVDRPGGGRRLPRRRRFVRRLALARVSKLLHERVPGGRELGQRKGIELIYSANLRTFPGVGHPDRLANV